MSIFEFDNYRDFINAYLKTSPKRGHGLLSRIAKHLGVHTTFVSQVFKGLKNLSSEQAIDLTNFLQLTEMEAEYFILLTQLDRAGTQRLKKFYEKKISEIKTKSQQVTHRLPKDKVLTEEAQKIFYSRWYYSAIRLLTSIPEFQTIDAITAQLNLPRKLVSGVMDFLLDVGMCKEVSGKLLMGPSRTHLEAESIEVGKHHLNWRLKSAERVDSILPEELMFSSPMTLSRKDFEKIRAMIIDTIEEAGTVVDDSPPELLAYLNIDWLEIS